MGRNAVETVMGALVLVVAAVFLFFAYTTSQVQSGGGYSLTARFDHVDGVRDGTDVRLSGIKIGSVISQTLDPKTFVAVLRLSIERGIQLPTDSVVTITSSGLLGDKYLSIEPGNEEKIIPPGGEITHTQSAMSLESLIGQVIFSAGKKDSGASGEGGGNPSGPQK
jgi:phospholipid/cholesterol/gamma-HCH transport system substrate-binding protein